MRWPFMSEADHTLVGISVSYKLGDNENERSRIKRIMTWILNENGSHHIIHRWLTQLTVVCFALCFQNRRTERCECIFGLVRFGLVWEKLKQARVLAALALSFGFGKANEWLCNILFIIYELVNSNMAD